MKEEKTGQEFEDVIIISDRFEKDEIISEILASINAKLKERNIKH